MSLGALLAPTSSVAGDLLRQLNAVPAAVAKPQAILSLAQPALTFLRAYELALEKDLTYAAALDSYRAMQEKVPQAKAAMRPNITLSAGMTASINAPSSTSRLQESVSEFSDTSTASQANTTTTEVSDVNSTVNGVNSLTNGHTDSSSHTASNTQRNEQNSQSTSVSSWQTNDRNVRGLKAESAVNLNWPVFHPTLDRQLEQSQLIEAQALLQLDAARQDVALRLARAYFDVLLGRENLAALDVQKNAIDQQLAMAQSSFEEGVSTIADVREAQAKRDAVVGQNVALRNTLRVKRTALQALIGMRADTVQQLRVEEFLEQFTLPSGDASQWIALAQEQSYEVQFEAFGLSIAQKELSKQTAVYKPTVDFVASLGVSRARENSLASSTLTQTNAANGSNQVSSDTATNSSATSTGTTGYTPSNNSTQSSSQTSTQTTNSSASDTSSSRPASRNHTYSKQWDASVGVRLNIPLFDGGMNTSRVREALALQSKKERDVQRVRAEAALAAETAYLEVDGFIAEAQALKAAETSGEVALESNKLGFEVGLRMNSDVLNAQQQLFTVRRDLMTAQVEALLATLRLKASVGALGEAEIGALDQWLR